jgi:hypothetical protein
LRRLIASAALALTLAACAQTPAKLPAAPIPYRPGIAVSATPAPLNPADSRQDRIGGFVYAGGLVLTSSETSRLHSLSDLRILADDRMVSVSDEGDLVEGHLVLDKARRLVGLDGVKITPMTDLEGKPIQGKEWGDAEGLAILPNGDRLVSFEQHHRVWRYPADGGEVMEAPFPAVDFPENDGMEALSLYPASGPDAYLVGSEDTGETWICHVVGSCVSWEKIAVPRTFGLVAAAPMPGGGMAYLLRNYIPALGNHITLLIRKDGREIARMDLARPLTVDNFEGLDAQPNPDGSVRFYLVSDDNVRADQRTLLLAFDWRPKAP